MEKLSHISSKAEIRNSSIKSKGLFANEIIKKDEIVAVKGGHIFDGETLKKVSERLGPAEVQIADNLFITSP